MHIWFENFALSNRMFLKLDSSGVKDYAVWRRDSKCFSRFYDNTEDAMLVPIYHTVPVEEVRDAISSFAEGTYFLGWEWNKGLHFALILIRYVDSDMVNEHISKSQDHPKWLDSTPYPTQWEHLLNDG